MRIFYAAPSTAHQSHLPTSKLWYQNLFLPLQDLGHELVTFNFDYSEFNFHLDTGNSKDQDFIVKNRPIFGSELLKQVRMAHAEKEIDLFFSYFYSAYVEPDVIKTIGEMGITTMNWYCNASYQFHLVDEIAPAYHYCLVPERFRLEDYRRAGANPIYCQEAANPKVYRPYDLTKDFDVTFVGQKYGNRPNYILSLLDAGISARVWGPHWNEASPSIPLWRKLGRTFKNKLLGKSLREVPMAFCGSPLSDKEYIQMYSRSKISLGFTTVAELPNSGEDPIKQVRLRDFEGPMSGAFYMVEYCDELTDFFEPDREIVYFNDTDELVDKARYYLAHEDEREKIRLAGLQRARTEHTWQNRFRTVFQQIGLN